MYNYYVYYNYNYKKDYIYYNDSYNSNFYLL